MWLRLCQPTPAPKLYPNLLLPEQVSELPLPLDFNLTLSSEAGISIAPISLAPERAARRASTSNRADSLLLPVRSTCLSKRLARPPLCTPAAPWPPFATAADR